MGAFSVAVTTVWNSLLDHLRDPAVDSEQFMRDLKTYLFAEHSKCIRDVTQSRSTNRHLLTYLLTRVFFSPLFVELLQHGCSVVKSFVVDWCQTLCRFTGCRRQTVTDSRHATTASAHRLHFVAGVRSSPGGASRFCFTVSINQSVKFLSLIHI